MIENIEYCDKNKEKMIKVGIMFFAIWIIIANITTCKYLYILLGIILLYVPFRKKHVSFSESGLKICYKGIFHTYTDILPISQMANVFIKNEGIKTVLCFTEEHKIRKVIIKSEYVSKIISIIKEQNEDTFIQRI